jgi:hypothetical protein
LVQTGLWEVSGLDIRNVQGNELPAMQSTSEENGNHGVVPFAVKRPAICALKQASSLFEIQPVDRSLSQLLYSLEPAVSSR